jgi:hypothetical protein
MEVHDFRTKADGMKVSRILYDIYEENVRIRK